MKYTYYFLFIVGLTALACSEDKNSSVSDKGAFNYADKGDSQQIVEVVKVMYKWKNEHDSEADFSFLKDAENKRYVGVNSAKQNQRIATLKSSGVFSEDFIKNYLKISETLDSALRTGLFGEPWIVGDLPPFGPEADPWCNCQDVPVDSAWWNEMKFRVISISDTRATLAWKWTSSNFDSKQSDYKIELIKENGLWLILWMQGFDFENFIGQYIPSKHKQISHS